MKYKTINLINDLSDDLYHVVMDKDSFKIDGLTFREYDDKHLIVNYITRKGKEVEDLILHDKLEVAHEVNTQRDY